MIDEGGESSSSFSVEKENSDTTPSDTEVTEIIETMFVYDTDVNSIPMIVNEASDATPTNKIGSDSGTTSTSMVIAEGGESSSQFSNILYIYIVCYIN